MENQAETDTAAWAPTSERIAAANLTELMHRTGTTTIDELHRWSTSDIDAFWEEVVGDLDIRFVTPPTGIRGSDDPTQPDWLPGATLNIVTSCLDHAPDAPAVVAGTADDIVVTTVGELKHLVASFAAGFLRAGFLPGDRVAIVMPMTLEAVVAYLGTVAAGGVVVSIADSFAPDEIRARFDITDPVATVTQDVSIRLGRTLPMYAKCVTAGGPRRVVVDTGAGVERQQGDIAWDDFVAPDAVFEPVAMPAGAHTNILFSSGTTGEPKAIPWTHTTPLKAAMDGRYHQDIHREDVVAWPTNLGWMMGPWLIYASLLNEATIALYPDAPTTEGFIDFVTAARVTMLGLVPSIVGAWRSGGLVDAGSLQSVKVLSSTGEASNADDYAWLMQRVGAPVIEYCGGTEIGGGYITGTVVEPAVPSRFTTPTLGLDLRILDDDGADADVGEVFLVPPSIGLSTELINRNHHEVYYAGVPEGDTVLRRHGDQLRRTMDGHYQALGRVDDTMNLGGIKVSSADLETVVGEVPGVREVAAVAVPPPEGGPDRLVVFAVPDTNTEPSVDELRHTMQMAIRSNLNPLFRVHDVVLTDALPRTASHKVMRRTLRAEYVE
jgi:acetyl-CoA synthetase